MVEPSKAQSDDCYATISYRSRDGHEATGTVGWREGVENRVVFAVWDGPSFAAQGADLTAAFAASRRGIIKTGFTPLRPQDGSLDDLFAADPARSSLFLSLIRPFLRRLTIAAFVAVLVPVRAEAEVPEYGKRIPFPSTPYDYRYEGPNYDARDGSKNSAARMRHNAKGRGDPDWRSIPLDPVIAILKQGSDKLVARYHLEGGQFCAYDEDNCQLDGIFPLVLAGTPDEPVLAIVRHVGAHGQRISVLRPLADREAPVFEATADFALRLVLRRDRLDIAVDRALPGGKVQVEQLHWPTDADVPAGDMGLPDITLPQAPALSASAAEFEMQLRAIAAEHDLDGFMALLADDVLVSFGGDGGKEEFADYCRLDSDRGQAVFWATLERLLDQGGWNEAGGTDDDGEPFPQRMTWPWFFVAWPGDAEAENVFIANADTPLRAAPDETAPILAQPAETTVLYGAGGQDDEVLEWVGQGWLEVVAPGGGLGFVRQEDVIPLIENRILAAETPEGWRIDAMVSGD